MYKSLHLSYIIYFQFSILPVFIILIKNGAFYREKKNAYYHNIHNFVKMYLDLILI